MQSVNVAMLLTWTRIALTPVFVWVFFYESWQARWASLAIVVLSELTDMFDGMAARKQGMVTDLGKIIDPFADSISRLTVFFCLAADMVRLQPERVFPLYLVLIILYRDSLVATVRTVCAFRGVVVSARASGKIKAIVQAVVILAILVLRAYYLKREDDTAMFHFYCLLLGIASVVTAWSAYDYIAGNWQHLRQFLSTTGTSGAQNEGDD